MLVIIYINFICSERQKARKWAISAPEKFIEIQVVDINPEQLYV